MTDMDRNFRTCEGRLVGGSVSKLVTKDMEGNDVAPHWLLMVALPKSDPQTQALITKARDIARADFNGTGVNVDVPTFNLKCTDGDSDSVKGRTVINQREGYPGHYVIAMKASEGFPFVTVGAPNSDGSVTNIPAEAVKRGDYIKVAGYIKGNGKTKQSSVYWNIKGVQLVRQGEAIGPQFDANAVFGGAGQTQSAPDIVDKAVGAAPPPPPPAPPAATGPKLTDAGRAAGFSEGNFNGWTEDQMRAKGYLE